MNPVILHYRNILENSTVIVTSENPLFPAYRLYDRNIGKLFKGDSAPANFYIGIESEECKNNNGSTFNRGDFSNGNAFFWPSLDLSPYAGPGIGLTPHMIVMKDDAGKIAHGFIGVVGAGETLGDEINSGTLPVAKLYKVTASEGPMLKEVDSGSVTQANMRISAVDGTAFVDFSAANSLTPYLNHLLVIKDSASRVIQGYIKAAGTGETLGDEILNNTTFDVNTDGWIGDYCTIASIAGGQSGNCLEITRVSQTVQSAKQVISTTAGRLYKGSAYNKSGTSGNQSAQITLWDGSYVTVSGITSSGNWTQLAGYVVARQTRADSEFHLRKFSDTAGTMLFDEVSFKQVLTPSATGVTITSTKGGETFNWETQESGFNYNDSNGYTYKIYEDLGYLPEVGEYFTSKGIEICSEQNKVQQVLDPPPTAIHIVFSFNGITRDWTSIESGFDPNDIASWKIFSFAEEFTVDRLIIPAGHNLNGLLLKLQYSVDEFISDINDAVSWTQPDSGLINKSFTPQNKPYWRLNIADPVSPPELAEMFLTKDYIFTRKTSYGSTEGHRRNISREESLSGRARTVKFGESRRSLKYDLKYFSNAQKTELEDWESTCEGVKPIYVTDHNGDLFFMEILNELHFVVASLNKWSCNLDLLEFL